MGAGGSCHYCGYYACKCPWRPLPGLREEPAAVKPASPVDLSLELRQARELILRLAERVADCSECLSRAAEKHPTGSCVSWADVAKEVKSARAKKIVARIITKRDAFINDIGSPGEVCLDPRQQESIAHMRDCGPKTTQEILQAIESLVS